jgi:hypothetical protein
VRGDGHERGGLHLNRDAPLGAAPLDPADRLAVGGVVDQVFPTVCGTSWRSSTETATATAPGSAATSRPAVM